MSNYYDCHDNDDDYYYLVHLEVQFTWVKNKEQKQIGISMCQHHSQLEKSGKRGLKTEHIITINNNNHHHHDNHNNSTKNLTANAYQSLTKTLCDKTIPGDKLK